MKRMLSVLALALAFSMLAGTAQAQRGVRVAIRDKAGREVAVFKESHALIIGVSDYRAGWPKLPGVKSDVVAVKAALESHGFDVEVVEDPTSEQLTRAFSSFINRHGRKKDTRLVFYYAGHGHTQKMSYGDDMGYIVPVDAPNPNRDPDGFLAAALDMQQIEVYAKRIQARHALFLFDSCFSGSIFALSRAVPANISYKTAL
ncbi:MAG: caspase family protein, partial [bacterium]